MTVERLAHRIIEASQQARQQALEGHWIAGETCPASGGEPFYLENPATRQQYGVYTQASVQAVAKAVSAGLEAQKAWSAHTAAQRAEIL